MPSSDNDRYLVKSILAVFPSLSCNVHSTETSLYNLKDAEIFDYR